MAVEQGPMSGFRDMLAEQMIPRQDMIATIQEVYESYGFTPLKTPAIERLATLTGRYGEEGDKLMYKFQDNGGRDVALRYDQTVPLARVVAQHGGNLPMPYKRYAVGEVWRGESPQAGRYREFTQFDADVVGTLSPVADAEIVCMMSDAMTALGADSIIRVNNRLLLDALVSKAGISTEQGARRFIGTIDKLDKIGRDKVLDEIESGYGPEARTIVERYLSIAGTTLDQLGCMSELLGDSDSALRGVENLKQVFGMVEGAGYGSDKIQFDPTIARGLDYYTGIIFETTLKGAPELGSVCSGGRYDNLVSALGGPDVPAVGTSIGVDRLFDGLRRLGKLREAKTPTQVLVANFDSGETPRYMSIARQLRAAGVPSEVYYDPAKVGKQLKFANKQGIPQIVLVGPNEIARGVAVIKSMHTGVQSEAPIEELVTVVLGLIGEVHK